MLANSLVTRLDLRSLGLQQGEGEVKSGCTFWTGHDGEICVQSYRPEATVHYQPHTHSEYTIVVCLEGEVAVTQLGKMETIGRGEALISNHGVKHSSGYLSRNGKGCEAVSLSLDRRLVASLTKDFKLPSADGDTCPAFLGKVDNSSLHGCAQAIARELREGQVGHKIVIEALAIRLLVEAMRSWPIANIEKIGADCTPRLPRRDFVRAYEFMRLCRKENFRLQRLCQFLGSSQEKFARLFLSSTDHTPASFYNQMLLERARDLLRDQSLSIKEISFDLGFKTSSHFVSTFRKEFATSPDDYRQRANHGEFCYNRVKPIVRTSKFPD